MLSGRPPLCCSEFRLVDYGFVSYPRFLSGSTPGWLAAGWAGRPADMLVLDIFLAWDWDWVIGDGVRVDPPRCHVCFVTRFQLRLMWHCPVVVCMARLQKRLQTVTWFSPPPPSLSDLPALQTGTKLFIAKSYRNASACRGPTLNETVPSNPSSIVLALAPCSRLSPTRHRNRGTHLRSP